MTRKSLFLIVMILTPLFVLGSAELILRAFEYGGNLNLVIRKTLGGREFYVLNRNVARRYFSAGTTTIPELQEDLFTVHKAEGGIRIFCLGESTMAGFPFEFGATPPGFLESELRTIYPDRIVEVVNVGLSAVGTFVIHDLLTDLFKYQPDLFIVYAGHNEFHGVFGVGSSIGGTRSPWITDLSITLSRSRLYLALRDMLSGLSSSATAEPRTLLEQMAVDSAIPYKSDAYEHTRAIYSRNVGLIIEAAERASIPVMFSEVVSNIADQPPFAPITDSSSLSEKELQEVGRHLKRGEQLLGEGSAFESHEEFWAAIALDSLNAAAWFGLGQSERALNDSSGALRSLTRAKDLDGLRLRMSAEFQDDLRLLCRQRGIPVAPADSVFSETSPLGLPGKNLFLEHVHPTLAGYQLLAHCWVETILADSLLPFQSSEALNLHDHYRDGATQLDSIIGNIRIGYLTHRWPFREVKGYVFTPADPLDDIALKYVQGVIPWQHARYEAASYYTHQGRFDLARQEVTTVAAAIPYSYEPILRKADYYLMEGKRVEALETYQECLRIEENPFAHAKIGLMLVQEKRFADAVGVLNNAFAAEGKSSYRFKPEEAAAQRYLLGFSYAQLRKKKDAIRELKSALTINPRDPATLELLSLLENDPGQF